MEPKVKIQQYIAQLESARRANGDRICDTTERRSEIDGGLKVLRELKSKFDLYPKDPSAIDPYEQAVLSLVAETEAAQPAAEQAAQAAINDSYKIDGAMEAAREMLARLNAGVTTELPAEVSVQLPTIRLSDMLAEAKNESH